MEKDYKEFYEKCTKLKDKYCDLVLQAHGNHLLIKNYAFDLTVEFLQMFDDRSLTGIKKG